MRKGPGRKTFRRGSVHLGAREVPRMHVRGRPRRRVVPPLSAALGVAPILYDFKTLLAGQPSSIAEHILSRHKLKRYRVSILRSVEILIHTFIERLTVFMNATAELLTGLGSVGVSKLPDALR